MKLLCLDSNSILNRAFYGVKLLTNKDGTYTNAIFGFMNILLKLLGDVQPDAVACAFDLKAPTFRHQMFDGYKAQRKGMPQELVQQLPLIKEVLTDLGYPILTKEGYEADDILGTLSAMCEQEGHQCYIATGDRDSLQLIGKNTTVLLASSRAGKSETVVCDEAYFREKYGTEPQGLVDIKALMGDSSDNIPGVPGIGEKTALKLIGQYGTLDAVYENIDTLPVTKSVKAKLEAGKDSAYMSRTLAKIDRAVPLDVTLEDCKPKPRDEAALFALLSKLEMGSLIKRLDLSGEYQPVAQEGEEEENAPLPEVRYVEKSIDELLEQAGEEAVLSILALWDREDEENLNLLAVCAGEQIILHRPQEGALYEQQLIRLFNAPNPKVTFDCKSLYHWTLRRGSAIANLADDILLSAYLLAANNNGYEIDRLCAEYSAGRRAEGMQPAAAARKAERRDCSKRAGQAAARDRAAALRGAGLDGGLRLCGGHRGPDRIRQDAGREDRRVPEPDLPSGGRKV